MNRAVRSLNVQLIVMAALGAAFLLTTLSISQADSSATQPAADRLAPPAGPRLLRESSVLTDCRGTVCRQGSRWVFTSDEGGISAVLLENRLLERVEQLGASGAAPAGWVVSGTVTEFCKRNYLLLTRLQVDLPQP